MNDLSVPRRSTCYQFTQSDLDFCIPIAYGRYQADRKENVTDSKYSSLKGARLDIVGILGEYAFCKLFGVETNHMIDTSVRNHWNDEFDATFCGQRVDVKSSLIRTKGVHVKSNHRIKSADYYVSMHIQIEGSLDNPQIGTAACFRGIVHRDEIFFKNYLGRKWIPQRKGYHTYYEVPDGALHSWPIENKRTTPYHDTIDWFVKDPE